MLPYADVPDLPLKAINYSTAALPLRRRGRRRERVSALPTNRRRRFDSRSRKRVRQYAIERDGRLVLQSSRAHGVRRRRLRRIVSRTLPATRVVGKLTAPRPGPMAHEPAERNHLERILEVSARYLSRAFTQEQLGRFMSRCYAEVQGDRRETIDGFLRVYYDFVKDVHRSEHPFDPQLDAFMSSDPNALKIVWGDCLDVLRGMKSESVQLMVTSPPYYNARDYSQWRNLNAYLDDMRVIIAECYRVLDNHRPFVFNVGDIFDNDHLHTQSSWGKRRIPLGAYFTTIFEEVGFKFVDDFIWDKGEVQSQRHKNGERPYPLYQYPVNCYEHIFVFYKHRLDDTLYPCPVCGCLKVNGNAYSGVGVKSWECKNLDCTERSVGNRGKRFSARSQVMNELQTEDNRVDGDLLRMWRRDVVNFPPVIKINSKGENILGHTAPFPPEIPAYAVRVFSGVGETVLDPFAGSFTTAIEAQLAGRVGVGIEINKSEFRDAITANVRRRLGLFGSDWTELDYGAR